MTRSLPRLGLAALAALCALAGGAPAETPKAPAASAGESEKASEAEARPNPEAARELRAGIDSQIAALEADIAKEEERLKELVSEPLPEEASVPGDSPEVREIARRLPALQARLHALHAHRARLAAP